MEYFVFTGEEQGRVVNLRNRSSSQENGKNRPKDKN